MCTPLYPQTQAEIDAGVVPTNLEYPPNPAPPERYGAVGDGETDDTIALQNWAKVGAPRTMLGKRYKSSDRLTFAKHASIVGQGAGLSSIDFSAATGTFTGRRAVDFSQGSHMALPPLANDVSEGDTQVEFVSAHNLNQGDIFRLHNPTSSSWSGFLSTYTKGEYCTVAEVIDPTTVRLLEPLYDGYTATDTDVHEFDYGTVHMEGVGLVGVGSGSDVTTLFASYVAHSTFRDVQVLGGGTRATDIRHAYDVEFTGRSYQFFSDTPGTTQYGLSITHCQDMRVGGQFQGERHAVVTGSTPGGGVVNRGILVSGQLKALINNAGDFHGNTEHSAFDGCVLTGGVALGGDNNALRNSTVIGKAGIHQGQPIRFREMLGFNFDISNVRAKTLADPHSVGGTGVVDIGGNVTTVLNANTTRSGTLRISDVVVDAPNANAGVRFVNRGGTQDFDIRVNGLHLNINAGADASFGLFRLDNVSGGNFRSISLCDMTGTPGLKRSKNNFDVHDIAWEHARATFTPAIAFGGQSGGLMYASQIGWYEVVGNVVHWHAHLQLTSKGNASGNATITGLPFRALNITSLDIPTAVQGWGMTFADVLSAVHVADTTTIALQEVTKSGALSAITDANFSNTTRLRLSGSYLRDG